MASVYSKKIKEKPVLRHAMDITLSNITNRRKKFIKNCYISCPSSSGCIIQANAEAKLKDIRSIEKSTLLPKPTIYIDAFIKQLIYNKFHDIYTHTCIELSAACCLFLFKFIYLQVNEASRP